MNMILFISMLFALQLVYWYIGRAASKDLSSTEDYFLAGKSVKLFPLMMTFLATQVGGGIILGAADEAYRFGWPVIFYPLGSALGFTLLGLGVGKKLAKRGLSTVAQIFEEVYGSRMLRKTASVLSIISLFMVLVAQLMASYEFLASLGLASPALFVLFWASVILYTSQGGMKAVIAADVAQVFVFSIIFLCCFATLFFATPELPRAEIGQISSVTSKLGGWLLMPLFFMVIEQDMGQRCFAGTSPKVVSKASLFAALGTLMICIIPVFIGSLAKNLNLEIPAGSSVLMTTVMQLSNPGIAACVGCAVLAAIISSVTSMINAISSNLIGDFQQNLEMKWIKRITCLISIAAIFFAFFFDNIVDLMVQSYEFSVSALFIPIFFAIFKQRGSFFAALLSILFGTIGFFLFRLYPMAIPKEILSILLSLVGYGCGELLTAQRKFTRPDSKS